MDYSVKYARRATKVLAGMATMWAAFAALAVGMSISGGSWQSTLYLALVILTPIAQVVLIGAGTVRDATEPRIATIFYVGAILCLLPTLLLIAFR